MAIQAGALEVIMFSGIARLQADMNAHQKTVGGAMKNIESAVASAKSALGALGVTLSAGYFVSLIKGSIDALDHLKDLSKSTNILAEDLAGLSLAAKQSGGDLDSIAASINKLSVNMGKDPEKFKALGVSAKEPLEAFKQLADIFNQIQDPQQRAAVMAQALGKSWAGAAPLLAEGSVKIGEMVERGRALSGVTSAATEQADAFNDKLKELTGTGGTLTRMVIPLLPMLNELADDMLEVQKKTGGVDSSFNGLANTFKVFILTGVTTVSTFRQIGIAAAGTQLQFEGLMSGGIKGFMAARKDLEKALEDEKRSLGDSLGRLTSPKTVEGPRVQLADLDTAAAAAAARAPKAAAFLKEEKAGAEETDSAYKNLLKTLKEKLLVDAQLTEVNKLQLSLDALSAKNLATITPARKAELTDLAKKVDLLKLQKEAMENAGKNEEALLKMLEEGAQAEAATELQKGEALITAYKTAAQIEFETTLIGKTNEAREKAIALREIELSGITREGTAREDLAKRMSDAISGRASAQRADDFQRKQFDEWNNLWSTVEQTGKSVFVHVFSDGKTAFEGIGKAIKASVIDLLYQITAKKWIIQLGTSAAGALGISTPAGAMTSGSGMPDMFNLASMGNTVSGWMGGPTVGSTLFGSGAAIAGLGGSAGTAAAIGELGGIAGASGAAGAGMTATGMASAGVGAMGAALAAVPVAGWVALAALAVYSMTAEKGGPKASTLNLKRWDSGQYGIGNENIQGGPDYAALKAMEARLNDPSQFDPAVLDRMAGQTFGTGSPADTAALLQQMAGALGPAAESAKALAQAAKDLEAADLAAAAAAKALAVERRGLEIRLMEATGDAIGALAAKREDERAATGEANRGILDQIYAAEDATKAAAEAIRVAQESAKAWEQLGQTLGAAVTGAADELRQAYQRESSDLEAMIGKWDAAGASLRAYSATLTGLGGAGASYGAASRAFSATAASARLGDLTAIGNLQAVSETFRTASLAASATQTDYLRDIGRIQAAIADTVGVTDRQGSAAQQQLDTMRSQVATMIEIKTVLLTTQEAIAALRAAVASQERFQRGLSPDGSSTRVTVVS